ncbi:MAG: acyl-[ACP]--phospholipid O-acyltransferase [Xanthobacteraceae bacterium]
MTSHLIGQRRFAPLLWTQFLSAFNDNFLKNALVFLILFQMIGSGAEALVTAAGAVFIAPFFLLSGLAGEIADRFDKAKVAQRIKLAEIGAAAIAVVGLTTHSLPVLFVALFLFGVVAALFGPIKYGILPDHLSTEELPAGNAIIEGATFIAILLGTVVGGLASRNGGHPLVSGVLMMTLATACWGTSLLIPKTAEAAPNLRINPNIVASTGSLLRDLWNDTRLWRTGSMVAVFWLLGAAIMSLLPPLVKTLMGGSELVVSIYLALFAIGIAVGSGLGSWLLSGRIVLLPVPVAAFVMGLFTLDVGLSVGGLHPQSAVVDVGSFFAAASAWRVGFDLFMIAVAGGVFIVPSFAAVQAWAPIEKRARIIAAVNVQSAAYMVTGAGALAVLQSLGLTIAQSFIACAAICFIASAWIAAVMPTNPLRDFLSILFRAFYRIEVSGQENIAKAGPNPIIALNHVSFLDAAVALAILDKDPVFAIDHGIAQRWWVKPFLKLTRALPLDPTRPLATRSLINAVKAGESLVIFPEGRLTVTGSLMKVYDGAGLIADKSGAMVVPVRIEGLEATIFSRLTRVQVRRRWFPKVRVAVLEPVRLSVPDEVKGKARRQAAGTALYQIMSDLVFRTTRTDRTVFQAVAEASKVHGRNRIAIEDPLAGPLTYKRLLIGANVIGRKLAPLAAAGNAIGVMLPSSNGAVVTLLGLMSAGRVPALINFTAGATNILAACTAAQITTIVTSRAFIEKGKLEKLVDALKSKVAFVYLEDVRATVSIHDKLKAALSYVRPLVDGKASERAAILFTSGSEGTPKGVVLSHANLLANAAQASARIDFGRQDKVFNVLPVFHSFGLTVGLVLPLISGVPVFLYPSPLHYRIVPELIYGSNATILFGTDTFLAGYARSAHPYDLRSVRYVFAGAEPVKESTRQVFVEKFALRILEGYGVTETAPVLAINTPMYNRFGTVGRIMPGMEARLEPVPGVPDGGRLYVRGPNVMLGYVRAEKPGQLEPVLDGWHDTGDIVSIDRDGFITIKGRAKRFAKVGGEMVSLAAVEAMATECWPDALSAAATAPDARKGERIILVTQQRDATREAFRTAAKRKGMSELAIPSEIVIVQQIPLLGSGKIDLAGVAKLASEQFEQAAAA